MNSDYRIRTFPREVLMARQKFNAGRNMAILAGNVLIVNWVKAILKYPYPFSVKCSIFRTV